MSRKEPGLLQKPNLYVVARFLEVLYRSGSPMKKTNIQLLVRLNYPRFAEYLEWLLNHSLVSKYTAESDKSDSPYQGERFVLSPKGVEAYHTFVAWVKDTMEDVEL